MPRKVFVAGEILTASDVNTNLMDQAVMVFDDATDRATAIPTPVEGMVTYLKDTDAVEKFDGSAFVNVDTGGLVAVKSAIRTAPEVFSSVGSGANVAVGGLSITHEVADPANRLIISAFFGVAANSQNFGNVGIAVHDGTNLLALGDAGTLGQTRVSAGAFVDGGGGGIDQPFASTMPSITFVHTPGAGSKTYTVRAINVSSASRNLFINRGFFDDNPNSSRAVSSITIQEVAV